MAGRTYRNLPTRERILSLLDYDPESGLFRWKETNRNRKRGAVAGSYNNGYIRIGFDGASYFAHRLAYIVMTGGQLTSADEVDHRNGRKDDNRWCNLRLLSRSNNVHNAPPSKLNHSGYRGVQWRPYNKRWIANISVNGRRVHLGTYAEKRDALAARMAAESKYGVVTYGNHTTDSL